MPQRMRWRPKSNPPIRWLEILPAGALYYVYWRIEDDEDERMSEEIFQAFARPNGVSGLEGNEAYIGGLSRYELPTLLWMMRHVNILTEDPPSNRGLYRDVHFSVDGVRWFTAWEWIMEKSPEERRDLEES